MACLEEARSSSGSAWVAPPGDLSRAVAEQQHGEAAANLDYARTQLGYSRTSAPIAGVVASVATQEGETVAASFE